MHAKNSDLALSRIHERVRRDLGGPRTPVDFSLDSAEFELMRKRLWGPLARDTSDRVLINPRWDEYSFKGRQELAAPVRRYNRSLIDTFWAGYPESERRELGEDVMAMYSVPAEAFQMMPFTLPFVIHQTVHLITNDDEFVPRLVSQLIAVSSLEIFGKKKIPAAWADPVARETFSWWGDALESRGKIPGLLKYWRGKRIYDWLGSRILELHREGRPLAGRFGDLYLFLRSHLPPTRAHLRFIDEAATAFAKLRTPGDRRTLESGELEAVWNGLSSRVEALKPGVIELTFKGGFVTDHFFAPRTMEG
jgi:hypothetical protein